MSRVLRIGISACFFHADPKRPVFKGKTLQYLEQSMARWILSENVIAYMIPSMDESSPIQLRHMAEDLDGLVLQGGSDVCPKSYGEEPLKPEWNGDYIRDLYEIALFKEFVALKKPVLGVCRGAQLINVAMGGTLHQDIADHRNWDIYDQNFHEITFEKGSELERLSGRSRARINSIHHQSVKKLGNGLVLEAVSAPTPGTTGIIEAFRSTGDSYIYAVQWHPEFQDPKDASLLNSKLVLKDFLSSVQKRSSHA